MGNIDPSTNPAIAKPGESSFLIPIPPQTIATILELNAIISNVIPKNTSRKKNIPKARLITIFITPIIPKFKDTIPSAFPIFFSTIIC